MMKVKQFKVKNQFIIKGENRVIFQSYDSIIASLENGKLTLGYNWDYSTTTSKYLYMFIDEYCYNLRDNNGEFIDYVLNHTNNKRLYINRLIQAGIIDLLDLDNIN